MSALELEILERFRQLDTVARRRLLVFMEQVADEIESDEPMSADTWQLWANDFRAELQQHYGDQKVVSSAELLQEAREERLDDLMGGR